METRSHLSSVRLLWTPATEWECCLLSVSSVRYRNVFGMSVALLYYIRTVTTAD